MDRLVGKMERVKIFIKKLLLLVKKNKIALLLIFLIAAPVIACGYYFASNYYHDNKREYFYNPAPLSKVSFAKSLLSGESNLFFLRYIQMCKRFPDNLKDRYSPISDNAPEDCKSSFDEYSKETERHLLKFGTPPWIDPWGRPYQIRYDLDRAKLQLRSQGRYLWTEYDDIFQETYFDGKSYKEQVEYCKKVQKDDMTCIFNRGWH